MLPSEPSSTDAAFRVLLVEDEFLIAMELCAVLERGGFEIIGPAPTVSAALGRLQTERPGAAVLDVSLRGEIVTPVAEVLVAMNVPFVLASAYRSVDFAQSPVLASARNLGKPTPAAELLATMQAFRASTAS